MNRKSVGFILPALLVLAVVLFFGYSLTRAQAGQRATESATVGTAFTYQGRLNDDDIPANGSYDFYFYLYDAPSAGNLIGTFVEQTIVVSEGLFTTELDFGPDVFNGEPRYLEIEVQFDGGGYFKLTPRQPLTAVPYASYADYADYASYADKVQPVENVVVVAKSGGDYTSVQDALDNITATASDPYLIRVAPGVYTGTVDLEPYVDIEGSGEGVTILRGVGGSSLPYSNGSSATLRATGSITAEVRLLTVESDSDGPSGDVAVAIWTKNVPTDTLKLTHVTATATGSALDFSASVWNFGVFNDTSAPGMTHVTATATGSAQGEDSSVLNYGVFNQTSSPDMTHVTATATGSALSILASAENEGVRNNVSSSPIMNNVSAIAIGSDAFNSGVYNSSSSPSMINVTATASGSGDTTNTGVNNSTSSPTMSNVIAIGLGGFNSRGIQNSSSSPIMDNVSATASGGSNLNAGVWNRVGSASTIRDSILTGTTNSLYNDSSTAKVANTLLDGPITAGATCFNTYDASFAAVACP